MTSRFLLTALLSAPLLVALQPRADNVSFQPEDGSSLAKEYTIAFNVSLGDITAYIDGQDLSESVPGDFELTADLALAVTDEYVETVEGVPHELIRTFDSMELYWEAADESGEADELGELEGKSVKFKWNEEDETYDVSYHESDGDADLLQGLGPDMDLRVLLPGDEVSEGDTWDIDPDDLGSVFFFGLNLDDMNMGDDEDAEMNAIIEAELSPQIEAMMKQFAIACEYRGGGVIGVTLEGEGSLDLTAVIEEIVASQVPDGFELDLNIDEATVNITIEGEGTLEWDMEAGHMTSFDMTCELELLADVYIEADIAGETHELEASIELLGDGAWEAGLAE